MFHSLKRFWPAFLLLAVAGVQPVLGFSLLGPVNEPYQVATIGYNLVGDDGAPKDLGDGYRWNTRNVFYARDASFYDFFGTNGAAQIDKAFAVYNALTNLSTYSSNLTEWPLTTTRFNHTAENLNLMDMKTTTMSWIVNLLGLAEADRWIWTLHSRDLPAGGVCPIDEQYVVVQRNFDPVTYEYSSFINGTLYTYTILEGCTGPNPLAIALPVTVDPTAPVLGTAVSSGYTSAFSPVPGRFYTGLTKDDVGGLRYLYATNRMNVESVSTNSLLLYTNKAAYTNIITTNLALFLSQAQTNNQPALQALYPNLDILSVSNIFTNLVTTNITAYFTNNPLNPAGTATLVLATNFTTNVANFYSYTFGNLVTNHFYTKGFVTTLTTNVTFSSSPFGPAGGGSLTTNVTKKTVVVTNYFNGDYYILPPGVFTNQIVSTQLVNVTAVTNIIVIATNAPGVTNNTISFAFDVITYTTNYSYNIYPVQLVTNSISLRQGLDKVNFISQDFDSLLNTFWDPVTNYYSLTAVTNGVPSKQTFQRIITQPDILFAAFDHVVGPATPAITILIVDGFLNFNTNNISFDGAGPGTIQPQVTLVFGKGGGPIYINRGGFFQTQASAIANPFGIFPIWGSFDGSTNAPVVYPDSLSLSGLENAIFFQILSGLLPNGSVSVNNAGNPYNTQLQAQGASPPFTWTDPDGVVQGMGLALSSDGIISGSLANTSVGTYDFTVQSMDSAGRVTQANLVLEIDP